MLAGALGCRTANPPPAEKQPEPLVPQLTSEEGRRVSIGGRSMYVECAGAGTPTVVFEAGLGGSARNWESMIGAVRHQTRACRYDRLGAGRSDPAPQPHGPAEMAVELAELLASTGERAPLVLVAHSLGGIIARLYVQDHPTAVVGLVLVESMHEDQQLRVEAQVPEPERRRLPAPLAANSEGLSSESLESGLAALRGGNRSLGSVPLVVLSAGLAPRAIPGVSEETQQRIWVERQALQAELARLSVNSVQVIAERSGHAIPRDQPELVVQATLEVVRAVQNGQRVERERISAR